MDKSQFDWKCQPHAEKIVLDLIARAMADSPYIAQLQQELFHKTSTRLLDWLDHIVVEGGKGIEAQLEESGFTLHETSGQSHVFRHQGAQLPALVVDKTRMRRGLALAAESIDDFLMVRGGALSAAIEGTLLSAYRRCAVNTTNGVTLWVVERRGSLTMQPQTEEIPSVRNYLEATEIWKKRPRKHKDEDVAIQQTIKAAEDMVDLVGKDKAAWIVLDVERQYWQCRNTAGQLQKNRQDVVGMGWANHDHHTFRSSRRHFPQLVALFEILGFHCRERFYAGKEAGWGAQIMENPNCRLILFLDVDLDPGEISGDFAHEPFPELDKLGTIGLWCELHGDSILQAGMHHLEAQFLFDHLTVDLGKVGVHMMDPFSFLPYLKQAFTIGETWKVDPVRVQKVLKEGKISQEQADKFLQYGAIGSHLENLQRSEGYKGFNPKNVSSIIRDTDPRGFKGA